MPTDLRRPLRTYTIRQLCLEFKCTPRALRFYEDKGLLTPARDGMNRVYSYRDRARLQLILRGKRVGLSLSEIGEILDLYEADESGAAQAAKSLRKFKERIVALEQQKHDIDAAIAQLQQGISEMERRLSETRPDLLPRAADYDQMLRRRLDDLEHGEA
ncbi:MerR family transcriptional regulator [Phenylobacterium sp. VNQ135]|uniref:MerR family transcriptional regulator n=1 Tax=Phenylobacterium sp. VNQ135 TaxID=3400922 RepID=UPI003BFEA3D3